MADKLTLSSKERQLIRDQLCPWASDADFERFVYICERRGLNPLLGQITASRHWTKATQRHTLTPVTTIDGFRLLAERTSRYRGQDGPYWCGGDGQWRDVWVDAKPPVAAKVGVHKEGFIAPVWGVARYADYKQTDRQGKVTQFWASMAAHMLAKVAEALAFRRAFPEETADLYTDDEMGHAGRHGGGQSGGNGQSDSSPGEYRLDEAAQKAIDGADAARRARLLDAALSKAMPAEKRRAILLALTAHEPDAERLRVWRGRVEGLAGEGSAETRAQVFAAIDAKVNGKAADSWPDWASLSPAEAATQYTGLLNRLHAGGDRDGLKRLAADVGAGHLSLDDDDRAAALKQIEEALGTSTEINDE